MIWLHDKMLGPCLPTICIYCRKMKELKNIHLFVVHLYTNYPRDKVFYQYILWQCRKKCKTKVGYFQIQYNVWCFHLVFYLRCVLLESNTENVSTLENCNGCQCLFRSELVYPLSPFLKTFTIFALKYLLTVGRFAGSVNSSDVLFALQCGDWRS